MIPRLSSTTSHPVDAYAFRIGGALITYFPETAQFSWYKYLEKIRTNPAWIPLIGPVPKSPARPNNTYLIQLFPRNAEWFDRVFAKFGEKNLPDALATALLLQIHEELGRHEGISSENSHGECSHDAQPAKLSAEFVKGRPVEPGGLSQERESNER